jgi:hypothetical protein
MIYINYQELSFIMKNKSSDCKILFQSILAKEKISLKDEVPIKDFVDRLGTVRSVDQRLDGTCKFTFMLKQCKVSYRNFLNDTDCIRRKVLTGSKSVFYKILTQQEIEFITKNLDYKHKQRHNFR